MANEFAPKEGFNVVSERPVQMPSVFGAVASLAGDMLGLRQRQQGTVDPQDNLLIEWGKKLEELETLRDEKGQAYAQVEEKKLARFFVANGADMGEKYSDVYTATTGRPWEGFGLNQDALILEQKRKDPRFQSGYMASFTDPTMKDATEEQRTQFALDYVATQDAAEVQINKAKAGDQVTWTSALEGAYETKTRAFIDGTLGGLSAITKQGGVIGTQDIQGAINEWNAYKATYSRPKGISDDQWKAEADRRASIDTALANLEKLSGVKGITTQIQEAAINQSIASGDLITALVLSGDPESAARILAEQGGAASQVAETLRTIAKGVDLKVNPTSTFRTLPLNGDGMPDPTKPIEVPQEVLDKYGNKTPEQIYDALKAANTLNSSIVPADMGRETARKTFFDQGIAMAVSLVKMGENYYLSEQDMKDFFGNPGFLANFDALKAADPVAGASLQAFLNKGLAAERARQNGLLESHISRVEETMPLKWNGVKFVVNTEKTYGNPAFAAKIEKELAEGRLDGAISSTMSAFNVIKGIDKVLGRVNFNPNAGTETTTVDTNQGILNASSVTATLLDRYEGAGDYDTLFSHAQKGNGPFAGLKVSTMTIGELKTFAQGEYGAWSREQLGYTATPMGRFQFVGSTLATVAAKMGLSDSTVFTPEVQNTMFLYHAKEVMSGKSQEGKRIALKNTWAGLKNASSQELDLMIAEIEGDTAQFGPGTTSTSLFGGSTFGEEDIVLPPVKEQNLSETATQAPAQPQGGTVQPQVASLATPVAKEQEGPSTASRKAPKLQVPKEVQDLISNLRGIKTEKEILEMLLESGDGFYKE
jgi:hypothetical protein